MKKYINYFIILLSVSVGLSSCLKETSHPPLYGWSTSSVVSFQDNGGADGSGASYASVPTTPYPLYKFSFPAPLANDTAGFDAIVIYGPDPASQDITVNLEVDTSALKKFNKANGTAFIVPDDKTIYSFPSSIVIKKGESQAKAHVVITTTSSFDYSASYALPLTITSATGATISSNFSTEINSFLIRNIYDGKYHYKMTGWFDDPQEDDVSLITAGANSVVLKGSSGGSLFAYYSNTINYTIDPSTNVVTVGPVQGGYAITQYPNVSKYNPDDGSIHDEYDILGAHIVEDFTYEGPR
ncbi:MAG TPA: DUF1735 domain-containing protein [Candidatus Babeliaceae bacterium]|nr:DUF1735 domain-containing protein [Candidatus Babeliaceae bacterium]